MIPEADTLLNVSAGKLLLEIAPQMPPGYGQGSSATVAMVLVLAAQEYAKGADTRIWENARMSEILSAAGVGDLAVPAPANGNQRNGNIWATSNGDQRQGYHHAGAGDGTGDHRVYA